MDPFLDPSQLRIAHDRERLNYSLGFLICRVVHLLFYIIAMHVLEWDHWTFYYSLGGTLLHASVVVPAFLCNGRMKYLFALGQAAVLVIDAGLIAATRYDLQDEWFRREGPAGQCVETTTQIFQFIIFFYMMFVLDDWYALVGALCVSAYSAVVLAAPANSEHLAFNEQQDLLCLLAALFVSVAAKRKMLQSKKMLMDLLDRQKDNVVREKVLRCEAEFTCERMAMQRPAPEVQAQVNAKCSTVGTSEYALSAQTAPPLLQHVLQGQKDTLLCSETSERTGDCLPATALASVENCSAPKPLFSLMPGQRVLCYDNVARGLAYATVKECHPTNHYTKSDWVLVTLEDGTHLQMTADHPVVVESCPPQGQTTRLELRRHCVRASGIKVEQDCLMVLKMVPTRVAQIESRAAVEGDFGTPEERWITLTVDQPDRHELFVASPNRAGVAGQSIAVGSSDRLPSSAEAAKLYCVKNSFIDIDGEQDRVLRRSNSLPSGFKFSKHVRELPPASDTILSSSTEASADMDTFGLTVGDNPARLSDFIRARSAGTSLGSMHRANQCTPCMFHFSWLRSPSKRSCKLSHMCDYCHDSTHHWGQQVVSRSRFRRHKQPPSSSENSRR